MATFNYSVEIIYYTAEDSYGKSYNDEIELSDEQVAQLKALAREGVERLTVDEEELTKKYPDLAADLFGRWEAEAEKLTLEAYEDDCKRVSEELGEEEVYCDYGVDLPSSDITITIPGLGMDIVEKN